MWRVAEGIFVEDFYIICQNLDTEAHRLLEGCKGEGRGRTGTVEAENEVLYHDIFYNYNL